MEFLCFAVAMGALLGFGYQETRVSTLQKQLDQARLNARLEKVQTGSAVLATIVEYSYEDALDLVETYREDANISLDEYKTILYEQTGLTLPELYRGEKRRNDSDDSDDDDDSNKRQCIGD